MYIKTKTKGVEEKGTVIERRLLVLLLEFQIFPKIHVLEACSPTYDDIRRWSNSEEMRLRRGSSALMDLRGAAGTPALSLSLHVPYAMKRAAL